MPQIISKPGENGEENAFGRDEQHKFGYFETKNSPHRENQEDALAWHVFDEGELAPTDEPSLAPKELAHRLWTSYQLLDKPELKAGTTASTTVYDGKGNLITATLADAAAFAVIYDKQGAVLGVTRLNSVTHKPTNPEEKQRIEAVGGRIFFGRVNDRLAVSRAIGDNQHAFKESGVCSEANIDITDVNQIAVNLKISPDDIGSMQIITTCDGFTDGAGMQQTKKDHEDYLLGILQKIDAPGTKSEEVLAQELALQAKKDRSTDNISIAIQTLTSETPPFILGIYDGHGGKEASCHVADNIALVFKTQCALSREAYAEQDLSVDSKQDIYNRDHPHAMHYNKATLKQTTDIVKQLLALTEAYQGHLNRNSPETKLIKPIVSNLIGILNEDAPPPEKIKQFYTCLNSPSNEGQNKNIDTIKKDTRIFANNFLKGLAIIAATLLTGILPGLLIAGMVYKATGRQPFDLFKGEGERFTKELELVKRQNKSHATFFQPAAQSNGEGQEPGPGKTL